MLLVWSALALGSEGVERRLVTVTTADGHELVGRLALPADAEGPVPVVYFVPGSGPWTYDRPIPFPTGDPDAPRGRASWMELNEEAAVARGLGMFNLSKRGCTVSDEWPWERVDRDIFGVVTHQDLVDDLVAGLEALRREPGVDASRLLVLGASEGTLTGPRMIAASPDGFVGAALYGYVEHDEENVHVWQASLGPFRNVAWRLDDNRDQRITREEWADAPEGWQFDHFDHDRDGVVTPPDLQALNRRNLANRLKRIRKRDDDWFWANVVNLNTAFVLEEWNRPPNHQTLLQLTIPIGIFHGEYDGNVPYEGGVSAAAAFEEAGRPDQLRLRIVPGGNHGLDRPEEIQRVGPPTLSRGRLEMYDWLAGLVQSE